MRDQKLIQLLESNKYCKILSQDSNCIKVEIDDTAIELIEDSDKNKIFIKCQIMDLEEAEKDLKDILVTCLAWAKENDSVLSIEDSNIILFKNIESSRINPITIDNELSIMGAASQFWKDQLYQNKSPRGASMLFPNAFSRLM